MSKRTATPSADDAIAATRAWIEKAVIGLNLCPFAGPVFVHGQIRTRVSDARTPEALLADLEAELRLLAAAPATEVSTTLLVHPQVLEDFLVYNDFLDVAEAAVERLGFEGVLQVASFHPRYQFEGTAPDDISNFTNRSPYPTLHLLREASVDEAIAAYPQTEEIYERNIETLRRLGPAGWKALGLVDGAKEIEQ